MRLRPYQENAINELRAGYTAGHLCQMLCMPTGSGKTATISHMIKSAADKGNKSLFIVERVQLVEQAVRHLEAIGLSVGVMQGANTFLQSSNDVIVASIQTINARYAPPAGFVVIDEAHILHKAHIKLMLDWNKAVFIGLSATPLRPDLGKYFTNLIKGESINALTDKGYLVPAKAFCPANQALMTSLDSMTTQAGDFRKKELIYLAKQSEIFGDIVQTWKERAEDLPTLCFAVDIAHSKAIVDDFLADGITAAHIDTHTKPKERQAIIDGFTCGDIKVLSSVNVLSIGFDVPSASCAILARPTLSEALHIQQVGRVIRPAPGKTEAIILDHAANTLRFGLPVDFEVPELSSKERKPRAKALKAQRKKLKCDACGFVTGPGSKCPACGALLPEKASRVGYVDGVLVEFGSDDPGQQHFTFEEKRDWYLAFKAYALAHDYKPGWAHYAYLDKFKAKPAFIWRDDYPVMPTEGQLRWIRHYQIRQAYRRGARA